MFPSTAVQHINISVSRPRGFLSMPLCLVASDLLTLIVSVAISLAWKAVWQGIPDWEPYLRLWPFLFVFIGVYALTGLYSGVSFSPPEELQRATFSSALVFVALAAITVSLRGASKYLTWTVLLAMVLTMVLFPLLRGLTRGLFANESWWGKPAVVFGAGAAGERVVKAMLDRPGMGLKPVAVVNHDAGSPRAVHGVPVMGGFELALTVPKTYTFSYAVLAMSGMPDSDFHSMVERYGLHFSRILMIPDFSNFSSLWVNPKSVGGMLGLEVCQQAFAPERQWPKRFLDLALTILGAAVVLPLIALIAMWIKLDSRGPALYSQQRISREGRTFRAWKFRTMVRNADQVLERCLQLDPALREEWDLNHKLKDDPRITVAGRFLRRTSLDELPQLWNVLMGDMSLVGPRPIVHDEIPKYGNKFDLYTRVKSGITGMWQISGRNDTSYEERVNLDAFYVRNWSVWLDLYILFRTIETVIFRKGAY
jgi:Undecaprenyl-phosphate galactose phosphotransferase WbaP